MVEQVEIGLEKLIELVTRAVIKELANKGINVVAGNNGPNKSIGEKIVKADMSGYKTPILSEMSFRSLGSEVTTLMVPPKTIITYGANIEIKKRGIKIIYKS